MASATCAVMIFGMAGLAVDIGRMYITKNEAQSYADSAALYAALQLDGSAQGVTNADAAVANNINKWNFATTSFSGTVVEYSANGLSDWKTSANVDSNSKKNMRYVRVTPTVSTLPLFFLPYIGTGHNATVKAQAIGGQVLKNSWSAGTNGIFPFSPIAHAYGNTAAEVLSADSTGNMGFKVGYQYTLRWPSNPNTSNYNNVCDGDSWDDPTAHTPHKDPEWVAKANAASNSQRGYIQFQAASSITTAIEDDHMDYSYGINLQLNVSVDPTNGAKAAEALAIGVRDSQDGDTTSTTYADYIANPLHNGRRLVSVIIQNGFEDAAGNLLPANQQAIGVGFAQFLLLPASEYDQAGNKPWCAVYVGNSPIIDADNTGGVGANGQGVSYVRLSQ